MFNYKHHYKGAFFMSDKIYSKNNYFKILVANFKASNILIV
jgi:hypothetical protein